MLKLSPDSEKNSATKSQSHSRPPAPNPRPGSSCIFHQAIIFWISFLPCLIIDQVTKIWAENLPSDITLTSFLKISLIRNEGIAFGIPFSGYAQRITSLLLLMFFIYFVKNLLDWRQKKTQLIVGIILAGIIGNLMDRFFRQGQVIDFIDFSFFPTFNMADTFISVGTFCLWIFYDQIFLEYCKDITNPKSQK